MTALQTDAMNVLRERADRWVLDAIEQCIASGEYAWVADPEVDGVVGLIKLGTDDAPAIVYTDTDDLEIADQL